MAEPDFADRNAASRLRWRRGTGIVLTIVGIAMASLAGLCGLWVAGTMPHDLGTKLQLVALFSGPFILGGVVLAWGGSRLRRPAPDVRAAVDADKVGKTFD